MSKWDVAAERAIDLSTLVKRQTKIRHVFSMPFRKLICSSVPSRWALLFPPIAPSEFQLVFRSEVAT